MDHEKLVDLVVQEVIKCLPVTSVPLKEKMLVLFSGGHIGLETAMEELRSIQKGNVEMTVVLSDSAEKVIGVDRIKQELGDRVNILTVRSPYPGKVLEQAQVVIVPVLTMNTAAKWAHLLADTQMSTLLVQSLLRGKPVIAVKNAADPDDLERVKKNMNLGTPALKAALQNNLKQLEVYGVTLVSVEKLAAETQKRLYQKVKTPTAEPKEKRQLLDAESVKSLVQNGIKTIHVDKGTIITPYALDIANGLNAVIIRDK